MCCNEKIITNEIKQSKTNKNTLEKRSYNIRGSRFRGKKIGAGLKQMLKLEIMGSLRYLEFD